MYLDYASDEEIREALIGRRIVSADITDNSTESARGYLTLDNGVVLEVVGNEGCGGCSSGWYYVSDVATCDNVITNVFFDVEPRSDQWSDEAYVYRVFVLADNTKINVVQVDGDDGNGYYGSGYNVIIRR